MNFYVEFDSGHLSSICCTSGMIQVQMLPSGVAGKPPSS